MIDAETALLSHPSTLECVSPNSGILFPKCLGPLARESPCIIHNRSAILGLYIYVRNSRTVVKRIKIFKKLKLNRRIKKNLCFMRYSYLLHTERYAYVKVQSLPSANPKYKSVPINP
jgi:hypothetical protein